MNNKIELYPPFDTDATCPKCGHDVVLAQWDAGNQYPVVRWIGDRFLQFMQRRCDRCSYTWREECLDTPDGMIQRLAAAVTSSREALG